METTIYYTDQEGQDRPATTTFDTEPAIIGDRASYHYGYILDIHPFVTDCETGAEIQIDDIEDIEKQIRNHIEKSKQELYRK